MSTLAEPMTDDDLKAVYLPTAEEIRAACLAIQATWTPEEERKRRVRQAPTIGTATVRCSEIPLT